MLRISTTLKTSGDQSRKLLSHLQTAFKKEDVSVELLKGRRVSVS